MILDIIIYANCNDLYSKSNDLTYCTGRCNLQILWYPISFISIIGMLIHSCYHQSIKDYRITHEYLMTTTDILFGVCNMCIWQIPHKLTNVIYHCRSCRFRSVLHQQNIYWRHDIWSESMEQLPCKILSDYVEVCLNRTCFLLLTIMFK